MGALVVAGIVATRRDPPAPPDAAPTASPTAAPSPARGQGPFPGQEDELPRLASTLPPQLVIDPVAAVPLSANPVSRALALAFVDDGPVYVVGDDRRLRRLDMVSLASTMDPSGNPYPPFGTAVLKPDGTQAAFPQRDHVVLVDLTAATARTLRVPGNNHRVLWQGEQLLVAQSRRTVAVDPGSGRVTPRPYDGFGLVAGLRQGAPMRDMVDRPDGGWHLRTWSDSTHTASVRVPGMAGTADVRQPGWAFDWQVAVGFYSFENHPAPDFSDRMESLLAVDANTGATIGRLVLTAGEPIPRRSGCCAVLGWLNQRAVLIGMSGQAEQSRGRHWVLAWDPVTSQVFRITSVSYRGDRLALSLVDGSYL